MLIVLRMSLLISLAKYKIFLPSTKIQLIILMGCAVSRTGRGIITYLSFCFSESTSQYFRFQIKLLEKANLKSNEKKFCIY